MKISIFLQICILFTSTKLILAEIDHSGDLDNSEVTDTNEIQIIDESLNICENFSCPNPPCQIKCDADQGFYPDSRNCQDYCQCCGHPKIPSLFNRCPLGTVWDPEITGCNHKALVNRKGCVDL